VTSSLLQKYPNPFSSHVLGADVIDRFVDQQGRLHTTRILIKTNPIPSWAAKMVNIDKIGYILETSIVDPKFDPELDLGEDEVAHGQWMGIVTRNLTHTKFMDVVERLDVFAKDHATEMLTHAAITSHLSLPATPTSWIRAKVETFGLQRFEKNSIKSRTGLVHVLERVSLGDDQHDDDWDESLGSPLLHRVRMQLKEKKEAFKQKREAFRERRELFKETVKEKISGEKK
jgi:hypothetical protein